MVCAIAVGERLVALNDLLNPKYRYPTFSGQWLLWNFVGLGIAIVAGLYAHWRSASLQSREGRLPARAFDQGVPLATMATAAATLVLFLLDVSVMIQGSDRSLHRYEMLRAVLMAVPLVAIIALAFVPGVRKLAPSLGLATGLFGLLTIGGAAFVTPNFLAGALFVMVGGALAKPEFWMLCAFLLSCVGLLIASIRDAQPRSFSLPTITVGVLWILAISPTVQLAQRHEAALYTESHELAKGGPYLMYRSTSCLLRYRAKAGGFPETLQEVDRAIPDCLQPGTAEGKEIERYRVEYRATGASPYQQFSLSAEPSIRSRDGGVSFLADESGIVRTFAGYRAAVASDAGVTPAEDLLRLQNCISDFARRSDRSHRFSDATVSYDADQMRYPKSFSEMQSAECFVNDLRDGDTWKTAAYRFSYRLITENGRQSFVLTGRPLEYGVTGIRSYFVDEHLIEHATAEDREATAADERADRCEMISLGTGCEPNYPFTRPATASDWPNDTSANMLNGAIAEDGVAKLLGSSQAYMTLVPTSAASDQFFIRRGDRGIMAFSGSGRPLWIYPQAKDGLAAGNSLYAADDNGILSRIENDGKVVWSIDVRSNGARMAFRDGILYIQARGLYAIRKDGTLLWRMILPGAGLGSVTVSANGRRLYVVDGQDLHAVDVQEGKRLWSIKNQCYQQADQCNVEELANGSVALIENNNPDFRSRVRLRLVSAVGEVQWTQEFPERVYSFEYLVPRGTNTIVVGASGAILGENGRGETSWKVDALYWHDLCRSQTPGMFYASSENELALFGPDGEITYRSRALLPSIDPRGNVVELAGDLILIQQEGHAIWSLRLPASIRESHLNSKR